MAPSAVGRSKNFIKIVKILFLHDFGPKSGEKKFQKNPGKISKFFFFDFSEIFFDRNHP